MNTSFTITPANQVDILSYVPSQSDSISTGIIGTSMPPVVGDIQYHYHTSWCSCCFHSHPVKSAREQVIDEILTKMAEAVSKDDFKQAKKLAQLAKAVKEL